MSKSSHAQTRSGKAASTGALPIYEKVNGFFAGQGDAGKFKRDLDDANKNSVPMRFVPGSREENSQYAAGRGWGRLAQTIIDKIEAKYRYRTSTPAS